jgi:hypothetical protein
VYTRAMQLQQAAGSRAAAQSCRLWLAGLDMSALANSSLASDEAAAAGPSCCCLYYGPSDFCPNPPSSLPVPFRPSPFQDLLTRHKRVVAQYLSEHYQPFFEAYNKLLRSSNYVTRRQSLKVGGTVQGRATNERIPRRQWRTERLSGAVLLQVTPVSL